MLTSYRRRSGCHFKKDVLAIFVSVLAGVAFGGQAASQQQIPSAPQTQKTDVAPRGHRVANDITYGDWQKLCFKAGGAKMVCRTTITGKFETGRTAIRVDLIEREGDDRARVQMFVPVGNYMPPGVKLSVDKGNSYQIPYIWSLTNTCIAADLADPKLIKEMEAGQLLTLEMVDSDVLSVTTSLPLSQFASVHKGAPSKTFEQDIDE